jgi:hypothetical protein
MRPLNDFRRDSWFGAPGVGTLSEACDPLVVLIGILLVRAGNFRQLFWLGIRCTAKADLID